MASILDPHREEIMARLAGGDSAETISKWLYKCMGLKTTRQGIRKWFKAKLRKMNKIQALLGSVPVPIEQAKAPEIKRAACIAADPFGQTIAREERKLAEMSASMPFLVRANGPNLARDELNNDFDSGRRKQK